MPQELDSCVMEVMKKGKDKGSAMAICRTAMGMKDKQGGELMKYAMDLCEDGKMYGDIQGVEIFEAGEWNGDSYSESDLDNLVNAFNETKEITKPYLKLGHGSKQKLLAEDELPAAGYINRIYREGKKILADFVSIPQKIYELIKNRAYSKVSSEIFVNFKSNGKTYPYALKAVALLGGATPAVHSLKEILNLYSLEHTDAKTFEVDTTKAYEFNSEVNPTEDNNMTIEELQRQNIKLEGEVKSFKEENSALEKDLKTAEDALKASESKVKEFKDKADVLEKEIAKQKRDSFEKEIDNEIKELTEDGKIVPAQTPFLTALLKNATINGETKEFTIGEKKFSDVKALVRGFIDAHVDIDTEGKSRSVIGEGKDEDAFVAKVNKYAKENGVTVKQATLILSESK